MSGNGSSPKISWRKLRPGLDVLAHPAAASRAAGLVLLTGAWQVGGPARPPVSGPPRGSAAAVQPPASTAMAPPPVGTAVGEPRTVAYVVRNVENTLSRERLVVYGVTTSNDGPSATWAYGGQSRWVEFTGTGCGQPKGDCATPFLAVGTALIRGKLTFVGVHYVDRTWHLWPVRSPVPASACSQTAGLEMGGHWSRPVTGRPSSTRHLPAGLPG